MRHRHVRHDGSFLPMIVLFTVATSVFVLLAVLGVSV